MCTHAHHTTRRHFYVTPTSYLELISTFKSLLNSQRTEVLDAKNRYDNGLQKIAETQIQVDEMQKVLVDLQPKLKEATIATDALLVQVKAGMFCTIMIDHAHQIF